MPWVNLDDAFNDHPKIAALSDAAFRLHVAGICYSNRFLTDGLIAADEVPRLVRRFQRRGLTELVDRGLWVPVMDGAYAIRDFLDWNRSREQIEKERQRQREGGRRGNAKRWGTP